MAASVTFYRHLGLPVAAAPGDQHVEMTFPNGMTMEWDSADSVHHWDSGRTPGTNRPVLGFTVPTREAVDQKYAELVAAGYRGHQPPYDAFWGSRYAIVDDPDNNPIGLMSPIEEARKYWPPTPPPKADAGEG